MRPHHVALFIDFEVLANSANDINIMCVFTRVLNYMDRKINCYTLRTEELKREGRRLLHDTLDGRRNTFYCYYF